MRRTGTFGMHDEAYVITVSHEIHFRLKHVLTYCATITDADGNILAVSSGYLSAAGAMDSCKESYENGIRYCENSSTSNLSRCNII